MLFAHLALEAKFILQIALAALAGGFVGYNRQREDKPAGMRTFMLVCMGSTLLTIVSVNYHLFIDNPVGAAIVPMQLASYAMLSIGFLGGGIISEKGGNVKGVTTAASVWVVAAIGVTIGFHMYILAGFVTLFEFIVVGIFWRVSDKINKSSRKKRSAFEHEDLP
ncbi:MAG: MgtC/SapB family protein [bacterium]